MCIMKKYDLEKFVYELTPVIRRKELRLRCIMLNDNYSVHYSLIQYEQIENTIFIIENTIRK